LLHRQAADYPSMSPLSDWPCNRLLLALPSRYLRQLLRELEPIRWPCSGVSMRTRRQCASAARRVEHPFGTLKMRMGATHFLMKRLPKVATEVALHVLAYNLTHVMNIIGVQPLLAAMRA
jgi:hypothetical protein